MDKLRGHARVLRNEATDAERHLWRYLRRRGLDGLRFRRQCPIADYIVDFVCPSLKLVIELDGGQHVDRKAYDDDRSQKLKALGYRVLRYWNDDVFLRVDDVLEDILRHAAKSTPPQPSPSLREREGAQARAKRKLDSDSDSETMSLESVTTTPSLSPKVKGRVGEGCS